MKSKFINNEVLISMYDIYEKSANPNWRGGDRHILFIKNKKYRSTLGYFSGDTPNGLRTYTIDIVGERDTLCQMTFIENKFVGEIKQYDSSYKGYAKINCFKDDQAILPFETIEEHRDRIIEETLNP